MTGHPLDPATDSNLAAAAALERVRRWFADQGWAPFDFQEETWARYLAGESGMLHAATGTGKTYAAWMGPVAEGLIEAWPRGTAETGGGTSPLEGDAGTRAGVQASRPRVVASAGRRRTAGSRKTARPLTVLWITPLRALANDLVGALRAPVEALGLDWTVEARTGDTTGSLKAKQRERLPTALVTTPESLSLLLSYPDAREKLSSLRCLVVDEWHELMGSKRGAQLELALARLRAWNPELRTWGLSATLQNLREAARTLVGAGTAGAGADTAGAGAGAGAEAGTAGAGAGALRARAGAEAGAEAFKAGAGAHADTAGAGAGAEAGTAGAGRRGRGSVGTPQVRGGASARPAPAVIPGDVPKPYVVDTIVPPEISRFSWAGHLGLRLLPEVLDAIESARTTLLFTNVRSQAEAWYQAILAFRPDWAETVALHHGSIDRKIRAEVEDGLRAGTLRCVVCTSSLDLGVDFSPVDQVIQIGSPKGIARLLQRAGRSGHRPGEASRVLCVPTHAFELVEFAAARAAMDERAVEPRRPLDRPLDVLVQHLVTVALAGGFHERELYDEVRTAVAFERLSLDEWRWALDFVTRGGPALRAYPQYARLVERDGWFHPASLQVARMHRLSIGTITGDPVVQLQFLGGKKLGTVEESFIARLRPGDRFVFAGRVLKLVRMKDMTAYVRLAPGGKGEIPRWYGARLSFSTQLGEAVKRELARGAGAGEGERGRAGDAAPDVTSGGTADAGTRRHGGAGIAAEGGIARGRDREMADASTEAMAAARASEDTPAPEDVRIAPSRPPAISPSASTRQDRSPEMLAVAPLLALQQRWSTLPRPGALLLEQTKSRDGWHAYLFPFEGRAVHEGLSALLAYRLARESPRSITVTSNDYGFELLSAQPLPTDEPSWRRVLSTDGLLDDLLASLNAAELDRRQFREIARVAGLVFPGYPGMPRDARQLQASSGLLYDVFVRYDPGNLLLDQARREVLDRQLEVARIREALGRIARQQLLLVATQRLTPLAFPLWADRIQAAHVSTEKWVDRVRRMAAELEKAASRTPEGGMARGRDGATGASSRSRAKLRGQGAANAVAVPIADRPEEDPTSGVTRRAAAAGSRPLAAPPSRHRRRRPAGAERPDA